MVILFLLFSLLRIVKLIITTCSEAFLDTLVLYTKVGTENSFFIFTIDTEDEYTRISEDLFKRMKKGSDTEVVLGKYNLVYDKETIVGYEHINSFNLLLESYDRVAKIGNMNFIIYNKTQSKYLTDHSALTFCHKISNENFSIVHQMYKNGLITSRKFGFVRSSFSDMTYSLVLGEFGDYYAKDSRFLYSQSFEVVNEKDDIKKWYVPLKYTIVGDFVVSGLKGYVTVNTQSIQVPKFVYDEIVKKYFKKAIEEKICKMEDTLPYEIRCKTKEFLLIDDIKIKFVLGEYEFPLDSIELFKTTVDHSIFKINVNKNEDTVRFGAYFLYNPTFFDYDNNRINFFSINKFCKTPLKGDFTYLKPKRRKIMLLYEIILGVVGVWCIIIFIFKRHIIK